MPNYAEHAGPNTLAEQAADPLLSVGGVEWEGESHCGGLLSGDKEGWPCENTAVVNEHTLRLMLGEDYDGPAYCMGHAKKKQAEKRKAEARKGS